MDRLIRRFTSSKPLMLSAAVLGGMIEFVALRRTQAAVQSPV